MTDPISDMLTRIRNALAVRKTEVVLPYSRLKFGIATILKQEGYLDEVEHIVGGGAAGQFATLRLKLRYRGPRQPAITKLQRVSTPGLRVYARKDELPIVLNNLGIAIISTSRGLMTNKQAKKAGLGGEVLCEIY